MHILSIREKHRESDDKLYYKVELKESRIPLIVWDTPRFSEGDDIPQENLVITGQGDKQTYTLKTDSWAGRPPEERAAIQAQVAVKILSDIFIAGKIKELQETEDYLAINLREWIKAALVHDPLMSVILEKVIWDETECAFKVDNKNMTGNLCFDDSRAKKNEIEVIGNIYENPELLINKGGKK